VWVVAVTLLALVRGQDSDMPPPFYRVLQYTIPMMTGQDVFIMQNLLLRSPYVAKFQMGNNMTGVVYGVFDSPTANLLLLLHSCDNYTDNGTSARLLGNYKYKFLFQVFNNRSYETKAYLYNADNVLLYQFIARLHGYALTGNNTWPDYTQDVGLNMFSTYGSTPTGFMEVDLNSPEPNPAVYGPYPVNRFINGQRGNAEFLMTPTGSVRNGILLHTGEWPGWEPYMDMPNSEGCIHGHPDDIKNIWEILVSQCGVEVRDNPYGQQPYPYQPQGVASIEQVNCQ